MPLSLDAAPAWRVTRLARLLRVDLVRLLAPHDLSPEQFFLLFRLYERDGRAQGELAEPRLDDRANISRLVARMAKAGLLRRARDDEDRRIWRVWLTDAGRSRFEALVPTIEAARRRLIAGIDAADLEALDRVLDRLEANLLPAPGVGGLEGGADDPAGAEPADADGAIDS